MTFSYGNSCGNVNSLSLLIKPTDVTRIIVVWYVATCSLNTHSQSRPLPKIIRTKCCLFDLGKDKGKGKGKVKGKSKAISLQALRTPRF
jgi:hypothetical protein